MQTYSRNKPFTIWAKTMWVPKREREALLLVLVEEKGKSQVTENTCECKPISFQFWALYQGVM